MLSAAQAAENLLVLLHQPTDRRLTSIPGYNHVAALGCSDGSRTIFCAEKDDQATFALDRPMPPYSFLCFLGLGAPPNAHYGFSTQQEQTTLLSVVLDIFTAIYKQSTHTQMQQLYLLYDQLYQLRRYDQFSVMSSALLELLQYSSKIPLTKTADHFLAYRQEADAHRYFDNVLQFWTLELPSLLHFCSDATETHGSGSRVCYNISISQINRFVEWLHSRIQLFGLPYDDCFNSIMLEKLAQMPSLFSFLLIACHKHAYLLSILRWVNQTIDNRSSALYKLLISLAKHQSNNIGIFNRLTYSTKTQADLLKRAIQLAFTLLPFIMVIHRVSTSFYCLVYHDLEEHLSLDLLGVSFFENCRAKFPQTDDLDAYKLISYPLYCDIALAVQHSVGPDYLFLTDILGYRKNVFSAVKFLDKLLAFFPASIQLNSHFKNLRERFQDLLDLTMWYYQYNTALKVLKTSIYIFPSSLLTTIEEIVNDITTSFIPLVHSPDDRLPRSGFTYALTTIPTRQTINSINIAVQELNTVRLTPIRIKDIPTAFYSYLTHLSNFQYPICGCYKPARFAEDSLRKDRKMVVPAANRPTSRRKKSVLRLTLDISDLQSQDASESIVLPDSLHSTTRGVETLNTNRSPFSRERSKYKYNHPSNKIVIRTLLLASLFDRNLDMLKLLLKRADFSCVHSISMSLQQKLMELSQSSNDPLCLRQTKQPIIPLQLGQHIIAVRTLLERPFIFSAISPLLARFISLINEFLLYVKRDICNTTFNALFLEQHYYYILFIEYHFKQCVGLGHLLSNLGPILLQFLTWKTIETVDPPFFFYVIDEFLGNMVGSELLAPLSYATEYACKNLHLDLSNDFGSHRISSHSYKYVVNCGQKLPVPEFLSFLWIFDDVFLTLQRQRSNCFRVWVDSLNQSTLYIHHILDSVPIYIEDKSATVLRFLVTNINPIPDFIRGCRYYQLCIKPYDNVEPIKSQTAYSFRTLYDSLLEKEATKSLPRATISKFPEALLAHGITIENSLYLLPHIPFDLSSDTLDLFYFFVATDFVHTYLRLTSLLEQYFSVCTQLQSSRLWSLLQDDCTAIDSLLKSYLSRDGFTWKDTGMIEQLVQQLDSASQAFLSHSNVMIAITNKLQNDIFLYTLSVKKHIKLPITQPLAPLSEFLASSRSWSADRIPELIVYKVLRDALAQSSDSKDSPNCFLPKVVETFEYHDYLSYGSRVLSDACHLQGKGSTTTEVSRQISLFVRICNTIEESLYQFKTSLQVRLSAHCKELELLSASSKISEEFFLSFLDDLSLMLHEVTVIWLTYLYLLCSPKTAPVFHVVIKISDDSINISPRIGLVTEVYTTLAALLAALSFQSTNSDQSITPVLHNLYEWARKLMFVCQTDISDSGPVCFPDASIFQSITGRLSVWISSILQIPALINIVIEQFPNMSSYVKRTHNSHSGSASFEHEYASLMQYLPLHLLISPLDIVYYYRFDGLLFYLARLLFLSLERGHNQLEEIRSTLASSKDQLLELKRSEDITLATESQRPADHLFLEDLLDSLQDALQIQGLIEYIPTTEQFDRFFAEFLRFKSFIIGKESQIGVITCGLYLLQSTGLADPLVRRASSIVKDLSAPILANFYSILNLYLNSLVKVDKECCLYLKHAMGQVDDTRTLILEYRFYPMLTEILEPAALIRTIHLLRSIFKIDCLKKLYEQISNKSQVLILYMQKNGIDIESTFKETIEQILALQGTINITYKQIKNLVDSTRTNLLSYTLAANKVLLKLLHDRMDFLRCELRNSFDSRLKRCIEHRTLTGSDIRLLHVLSSRALLTLEELFARIKHMYSKLCYHYELCYLQGIFGTSTFMKNATSLLDFILDSIKATRFPDCLSFINFNRKLWWNLHIITGKVSEYLNYSLGSFYEHSREILAMVSDGYTICKPPDMGNLTCTDFWNWYTDILHILYDVLLSVIHAKDFNPEQWKDLIYQIKHTRQDLCGIQPFDIGTAHEFQFTFEDVLLLHLNIHPDILKGKISMAAVNSLVLDKVKGALTYWSNLKPAEFLDLSQSIVLWLLSTTSVERKCPYFRASEYCQVYDLLSFSILQRNLELTAKQLVSSSQIPLPSLSLLLDNLDLLRTVADMKYSERSFPALTRCQVYFHIVLSANFLLSNAVYYISHLYNFLIAYSYIDADKKPGPFYAWCCSDTVQLSLRAFSRVLSLYTYLLKCIHQAPNLRSLFSMLFQLTDFGLQEIIEDLLNFLDLRTPNRTTCGTISFNRTFNTLIKNIHSYLCYTETCNFDIHLYDIPKTYDRIPGIITEETNISATMSGASVTDSEHKIKEASIYSLIILLAIVLEVILQEIIQCLPSHLSLIPTTDDSEFTYVAAHVVGRLSEAISPCLLFTIFSEGLDIHVTPSLVLSLLRPGFLEDELASGSLYYASPVHNNFLYTLASLTNTIIDVTNENNFSLFHRILLSQSCKSLLATIFPGYLEFIVSEQHPNMILGYRCAFLTACPFIFYRPICTSSLSSTQISTMSIQQLHPLWFLITFIFHCYEETLRIGALLTLRALRTMFSLSLSVDICTTPGMGEEAETTTALLLYGYWDINSHQYEPIPFQAIYIGTRMFLDSLALFQYEYTGKTTATLTTTNDFLMLMLTILQGYRSALFEMPLNVLATPVENTNMKSMVTQLGNLPHMIWKIAILCKLFDEFLVKLKAAETSFQSYREKEFVNRKAHIDSDFIAKVIFQDLILTGVLFLQTELNVLASKLTTALFTEAPSFTTPKTVGKDSLYIITKSNGGIETRRVVFAELVPSLFHPSIIVSITTYSPTLSVTRDYISNLFEANSHMSMAAHALKLLASIRTVFQEALFPDMHWECITMPVFPQIQEIVLGVVHNIYLSNRLSYQKPNQLVDQYSTLSVSDTFILLSANIVWDEISSKHLVPSEDSLIAPRNSSIWNRIQQLCRDITDMMQNTTHLQVTFKSLEHLLTKFLYYILSSQSTEINNQTIYFRLSDMLRTLPLLSLEAMGQNEKHFSFFQNFRFETYISHAHAVIQHVTFIDLDERLLQCMDPLIEWLVQKLVQLQYMLLTVKPLNIIIFHGLVFSYVHIFPWLFYRTLKSIGLPVVYQSLSSSFSVEEEELEEKILIYTQRLYTDQSIDTIITGSSHSFPEFHSIILLTAEDLTQEQINYCIANGIPIISTVRPINDAHDFKHLELLSIFTNLHSWCHPIDPKINGTWNSSIQCQKQQSIDNNFYKDARTPANCLSEMHLNISYQRARLTPYIAHSFIELSTIYIDHVEKAVLVPDDCVKYRFHAITSALSIVLAILDTLLLDRLIRTNIMKLGTVYFNAIVVFACSWAYAALPIKNPKSDTKTSLSRMTLQEMTTPSRYMNTTLPRYSPFLLRTVASTVQSRYRALEATQISWPVFLSNVLGSLVLTKIGCFASNIYSFVPVVSVQKATSVNSTTIKSISLVYTPWPALEQLPPVVVPQVVLSLCHLYSADRLLAIESSLSSTEYLLLATLISHLYSLDSQDLPRHRCINLLSRIFISTNQGNFGDAFTRECVTNRRLTPLQIMHGALYSPASELNYLVEDLQGEKTEFCPLIMTSIPLFKSSLQSTYNIHSYMKLPDQILYILNHNCPGYLLERLSTSQFLLIAQSAYLTTRTIHSHFTFVTPHVNISQQTLAYQIFHSFAERMIIFSSVDIYDLLIQITIQSFEEYQRYINNSQQFDMLLSILSHMQALLEGIAFNEKITRQIYVTVTREELAGVDDPLLTPRIIFFTWLLSMIDFCSSQFSKAFYDSGEQFSFRDLKGFFINLLTLATTKAGKYVDSDSDSSFEWSLKRFAIMEVLDFYRTYPLFTLCLNHNNLFLPVRLRNLPSFPIRSSINTMSGIISGFSKQIARLNKTLMCSIPPGDETAFLRLLSLQLRQGFFFSNNRSLPLARLSDAPSTTTKNAKANDIGLLCTRALQCINFNVLCDLFATVCKTVHSSMDPIESDEGYYTNPTNISMPAFHAGTLLHWISILPVSKTDGVASIIANHHLKGSHFMLTEPGFSLRDSLAFACNMRGLPYPLEVVGHSKTDNDMLIEIGHALSKGYMLAAWLRKPVCIYLSPYVVYSPAVLEAIVPLLEYGYSPTIMNMLTDLEQYTLARSILTILFDSTYNPATPENIVFKDFSSLIDGPLERVRAIQVESETNVELIKALRSAGIKRVLSMAALAHFSIPISSTQNTNRQNVTSQLRLRYTQDSSINILRTLTEVLCLPLDVLTTDGIEVSLSSLVYIYVDVPIYSYTYMLLRTAQYIHIYNSNIVTAMVSILELGLVEETVYKELVRDVPEILQEILTDEHCLKLARIYRQIITYLAEELDRRLLFYYSSYSSCLEYSHMLKSLLLHRKHTFTIRYEHYDLALVNLQLVNDNSEQALDRCRRISAEIQAHSLSLQNTSFELSHLEEEILSVKQQLCIKQTDKKYAEDLLRESNDLQSDYKKQVVLLHKQMNRIIDYQNSVNPILFAAGWQISKHFQECLSLACLYLSACTSKKVSVFALSVPTKGTKKATQPAPKKQNFTVDTFKRRVSNIDLFLKEMIAPSPEEIVNSPHYQTIVSYVLEAINSISDYKHTSRSFLVPIEQVKVVKEPGNDFLVLPKELARQLPPFYSKEKARYIPSTSELLKVSVEVRNIHVIAEMLLWILFFQLELCNMWVDGEGYRNVITEQKTTIATCTYDITSLEKQLLNLETLLTTGKERHTNLAVELETLREKYVASKEMLSTTSSILNSISDLKQAWLGSRADMRLKLTNLVGDSIVLTVGYTMLLHVHSSVRCKYLPKIARILTDTHQYTTSPSWTNNGFSDGSITQMTLCSNELMQIQYATLTSHLFSPQAPLYEHDINIVLSNTSVNFSNDIDVSEDDWLSLINCFGSLSELEGDILRHGSVLIHETIVFYITALLFGQRNAAILVTERTAYHGRLLLEIISKISNFYARDQTCIRPIFLRDLEECTKMYVSIPSHRLTDVSSIQDYICHYEAAVSSVSKALHTDTSALTTTTETLSGASIIIPILLDNNDVPLTALTDLFLGANRRSINGKETIYSYMINRQSTSFQSSQSKPSIITSHYPMRVFLTAPSNSQPIPLVMANNHLLSFCSLIDLEVTGYHLQKVEEETDFVASSAQHRTTDFPYLHYSDSLNAASNSITSINTLDTRRIYQEISRYGCVFSAIDDDIVDFMCRLQSSTDTLNNLTSKMLHLVLLDDKAPFLEAIVQVHKQMKLVTAMVIKLKKKLFLNIGKGRE